MTPAPWSIAMTPPSAMVQFNAGLQAFAKYWSFRPRARAPYRRRRSPFMQGRLCDASSEILAMVGGEYGASVVRPDRKAAAGSSMPIYTLVMTGAAGHQHVTATEFADDETAIADASGVLTQDNPVIAVARGAGPDVEFLGAWDWSDGARRWTQEE